MTERQRKELWRKLALTPWAETVGSLRERERAPALERERAPQRLSSQVAVWGSGGDRGGSRCSDCSYLSHSWGSAWIS